MVDIRMDMVMEYSGMDESYFYFKALTVKGWITMHALEKVIKGLDEITHYNGEQMFYNDIFIRGIADDAIALLKEQEDMIPIQTVAEYLAQYTAPPVRSPLAVYGDLVKAWERFLDGLRKRENKND